MLKGTPRRLTEPDWKPHWRDLTPAQLAARLETTEDLRNQLDWYRGDPRLTAWEEAFLTGIVRMLQTYHGTVEPTRKQWAVIRTLQEKLEAAPQTIEDDED
jgi:hypothetical protein